MLYYARVTRVYRPTLISVHEQQRLASLQGLLASKSHTMHCPKLQLSPKLVIVLRGKVNVLSFI